LDEGDGAGVLHRVLGELEVADQARNRRDCAQPVDAKDRLEIGGHMG
jgi:hypothetical protein